MTRTALWNRLLSATSVCGAGVCHSTTREPPLGHLYAHQTTLLMARGLGTGHAYPKSSSSSFRLQLTPARPSPLLGLQGFLWAVSPSPGARAAQCMFSSFGSDGRTSLVRLWHVVVLSVNECLLNQYVAGVGDRVDWIGSEGLLTPDTLCPTAVKL